MDQKIALELASKRLANILEAQPNLLQYEKGADNHGKNLANFCIEFIETYAAWLQAKGN
nr:hypothetical protein [Herbaspirillum sp. ASV7]